MPVSSLVTRRRLLVALVVLVLAVAAVVTAVALRPDADPAAGGTQSAGPTSGEGSEQATEPDAGESSAEASAPAGDAPDAGTDEGTTPEARETLDPRRSAPRRRRSPASR